MIPRLKTTFEKEILPKLMVKLKCSNKHQVPRITKVVLNIGLGEDATDAKKIKAINMIKKHQKPTKENKGGIVSKESFIHYSNVKNLEKKKENIKKWPRD